jgi:hypothetical protein
LAISSRKDLLGAFPAATNPTISAANSKFVFFMIIGLPKCQRITKVQSDKAMRKERAFYITNRWGHSVKGLHGSIWKEHSQVGKLHDKKGSSAFQGTFDWLI